MSHSYYNQCVDIKWHLTTLSWSFTDNRQWIIYHQAVWWAQSYVLHVYPENPLSLVLLRKLVRIISLIISLSDVSLLKFSHNWLYGSNIIFFCHRSLLLDALNHQEWGKFDWRTNPLAVLPQMYYVDVCTIFPITTFFYFSQYHTLVTQSRWSLTQHRCWRLLMLSLRLATWLTLESTMNLYSSGICLSKLLCIELYL